MPRSARGSSSAGVDRNALERDRRLHKRELLSRLAFLLPSLAAKRSVTELLDQAITRVKELGERVEMLKQKKQLLQGTSGDHMMDGSRSTVLTVRDVGSMLEVCLKSGSNKTFKLHQVIQVLVEEAAEVVCVSYSNFGGIIFYTIQAQAVSPRIGIETSTVHERLKELIFFKVFA